MLYVVVGVVLWQPISLGLEMPLRVLISLSGVLLYFPGILLYLWAYTVLGKMYSASSALGATLYKNHMLIREGPYGIVRHPMYLGVLTAVVGALLIFRTWAMVLFASSSFVVIIRARREDELLSQEFGNEWLEYRKRVPGWIPNFRRRNGAS